MNSAVLRPEVQAFLKENEHTAITTFLLKGSPFEDISIQELTQQLEGKRKAKHKLPLWYQTDGILFPPKIHLEQTSSEVTAAYKASLMRNKTLADLTGGLGIDTYYFSKKIAQVTHIEMDMPLSAFAKANFERLNATSIKCIVGNAIDYIKSSEIVFDTLYADPGRRSDAKGKVFMLKDCLPNIPEHLDMLLSKCKILWVKTAPILDITAGLKELRHVTEIHIVAVKNEVKELLWCIESKKTTEDIHITTVNIKNEKKESYGFSSTEMNLAVPTYSLPKHYLYEPNASLMKSGAFNWISAHFQLDKLHPHSHLYTHTNRIDFPGRSFEILEVLPFSSKIQKKLAIKTAHITTRNFPLSVAQLRKKLAIKEGGDTYLFFTTLMDGQKTILICKKSL